MGSGEKMRKRKRKVSEEKKLKKKKKKEEIYMKMGSSYVNKETSKEKRKPWPLIRRLS